MQTELIIVSEYCQKCHIEPSFIEMLEEGGLINVRTEAGKHYLLVSELPLPFSQVWRPIAFQVGKR